MLEISGLYKTLQSFSPLEKVNFTASFNITYKWGKEVQNRPRKICGIQTLKNLT